LNKKKVLVFIDWYLPGFKAGGPIQSCANIIAHLQPYFDFSVVTSDTDYTSTNPYPEIISNTWNNLNGTPVFYFSKAFLTWKNTLKILKEEKYDVVYMNSLFSVSFTIIPLFLLKILKTKSQVILAPRGMFGAGALSVKSFKKKTFLKLMKVSGIFKMVHFQASSEAEAKDIVQNLGPDVKIQVAFNLLSKKTALPNQEKHKEKGSLKMVSISRISPEKNLLFTLKLLSQIKGTSHCVFDIYGPINDNNYWLSCQELIKILPKNILVNYKGAVENKKVSTLLTQYHLMVLPSMGENFGHIILESFCSGCPVLIGDKTPWHHLEDKGIGADIALDKESEFVRVIEKYVSLSENEFTVLSNKAYEFGMAYLNDEKILKQNLALFSSEK
jgi:glycosyltransferase involved in cell wall biosynthesis